MPPARVQHSILPKAPRKRFTVLSQMIAANTAIMLRAVGQTLALCLGPMEKVERGLFKLSACDL